MFGSSLNKDLLVESLKNEFKNDFEYELSPSEWSFFGFIQNVKIDIVQYDHPVVEKIEVLDGIRMYSTKDIAAMKINAILGRGTKKDFYDLSELLHNFSLNEIINFHSTKFPGQQLLISIPQALVYFDDAELSGQPVTLKGHDWNSVKEHIRSSVRDYLS